MDKHGITVIPPKSSTLDVKAGIHNMLVINFSDLFCQQLDKTYIRLKYC